MNIFDILVVQPIFNLLTGLYIIIPGGDFGISIIIFTILVRFALYPLTKKMLHQSRIMKKLQPELAKIKTRNKGNKQQESMQMMELYKQHGVNPFRSIGILLIQLPIFLALFQVIRVFTEHRDRLADYTYDFMENWGRMQEILADPEHFNATFLGFVDLTKSAFTTGHIDIFLILLAAVAGLTQYIMSKQTMPQQESKKRLRDVMAEAAEGKQADQSEMNAIVMTKMIKVMPIFMFFIMISVPGALALYYATSNIVAVGQQFYLLKKDEDELDDIAEAGVKKADRAAKKAKKAKAAKEAQIVQSTKSTKATKANRASKAANKPAKKSKQKSSQSAKITRITAKDSGRKKA